MPDNKTLLLLPGDGIGPEVTAEVRRVVDWIAKRRSVSFDIKEGLVGGAAYDADGEPLTDETMADALNADAVLLGAVGGPKWEGLPFEKQPERGLLRLRKEMELFANLRPAVVFDALADASTLKLEVVQGLDIMIVRELTGGVYFGEPRGIETLADLKGKTFAFGDKRSTIGRYLAQLHLLRHDVKAHDLAHSEYLGRHDAVGAAVGAGRFDAGALKESTFKKLVADGVPIRAIARFPNVTKPWIARGGLPDEVRDLLREALLSVDDPKAMTAPKKDRFVEGSDEDYAFIREAMVSNHLFFRNVPSNPANSPSIADRNAKE